MHILWLLFFMELPAKGCDFGNQVRKNFVRIFIGY